MKHILLFAVTCIVACSDSEPTSERPHNRTDLLNFAVKDVTTTGFTVTLAIDGDANQNATAGLSYCPEVDGVPCVPSSAAFAPMTRSADSFSLIVDDPSLQTPPVASVVVEMRVNDPDGTDGSASLTGTVSLPVDFIQLGEFTFTPAGESTMGVHLSYAGDANGDGSIVLYTCDLTDQASCDPSATTGSSMTRGTDGFEGEFTGTTGHEFAVRAVASDADGVVGGERDGSTFLVGDGIAIFELRLTALNDTSLAAVVSFVGDVNSNATLQLKYCSQVPFSTTCNPSGEVPMQRGDGVFTATINGLEQSNKTLLEIVAADSDGVTDSTHAILANMPLTGAVTGTLPVASEVTGHSFKVTQAYLRDGNNDASATLYYCNDTDSAGCNPLDGRHVAMVSEVTDVASATKAFIATLSFTPPDDPGDSIALRVEMADSEPVAMVNHDLEATVQLLSTP